MILCHSINCSHRTCNCWYLQCMIHAILLLLSLLFFPDNHPPFRFNRTLPSTLTSSLLLNLPFTFYHPSLHNRALAHLLLWYFFISPFIILCVFAFITTLWCSVRVNSSPHNLLPPHSLAHGFFSFYTKSLNLILFHYQKLQHSFFQPSIVINQLDFVSHSASRAFFPIFSSISKGTRHPQILELRI